MELRYIRDTDGREVDFVVLRDGKIEFAVECKLSASKASDSHLHYFQSRLDFSKAYIVHTEEDSNCTLNGVEVLPFLDFCLQKSLP